MSSMFERFIELAKKEFGLTIIETDCAEQASFESIFGVPTTSFAEHKLPYDIACDDFYYLNYSSVESDFIKKLPTKKYACETYANMAA